MRTTRFARVVSQAAALGAIALAGPALAADNDGLTLAPGFAATVVQEGLGSGRHLAITDKGDIYLAAREIGRAHV